MNLPIQIQRAVLSLFISGLCSMVGAFYDARPPGGYEHFPAGIMLLQASWFLAIGWLSWEIVFKKHDMRGTLMAIGFLLLCRTMWDVHVSGFEKSQMFAVLECLMIMLAGWLTNSEQGKQWIAGEEF